MVDARAGRQAAWHSARRGDGSSAVLAAPQHELEGRVVVLAGLDREIEQRLALGGASPSASGKIIAWR
jgi:hypothetical protein